jgi:ParB-like chromosome segregation protein Spo0J
VRVLTDAQALVVLSEENAQREDLDDIERARQIEQLCRGVDEGGAGLTRAAAGGIFDLSESAASNLVGLLELPEVWQQRVKRGELPQTFARLLRPYAPHKKLVDAIDKWMGEEVKREGLITWSREDFEYEVRGLCSARGYGAHRARVAEVPRGPLTAEEREKLQIVTLPAIGKYTPEVEICLNEKVANKLADRNRDKAKKTATATPAKASQPGKSSKPKPPTAAELRANEKEAAQRTAKAIGEWRHHLLRAEIAALLKTGMHGEVESRLVLLLLTASSSVSTRKVNAALSAAIRACGGRGSTEGYDVWPAVASVALQHVRACVRATLVGVLSDEAAYMTPRVIDDLALELSIDIEQLWRRGHTAGDPLHRHFARFFDLHTKDQLAALGKELGVDIGEGVTKGAAVKHFLGKVAGGLHLRLPKSIAPVKAKRVSRRKAPARKK